MTENPAAWCIVAALAWSLSFLACVGRWVYQRHTECPAEYPTGYTACNPRDPGDLEDPPVSALALSNDDDTLPFLTAREPPSDEDWSDDD